IKILGLIWDSKLTWAPHIKQLKAECQRRTNIIKVLASTHWGSAAQVLIKTYKALIETKLNYGAEIYSSATNSNLKLLNSVQTTALRLAVGAFRSSPTYSILAEANEIPLRLKRMELAIRFTTKTLSTDPD
ncbi:GSCOCG00012235001-RA-CDS, partial [Cotesia congregata]